MVWTPQRLTQVALSMAWAEGQTLTARWEQAVEAAEDLREHWRLGTSYSGFAEALVRESPRLTTALQRRFQRLLRTRCGAAWQRHGWLAFAVDGTRIEAPRVQANEVGLGCAGREKSAPQVFLTVLWHMGTSLPWDYRLGPGTDSEQSHLQAMVPALPAAALLVADAGFVSYDLCRQLLEGQQAFLLRVGSNRTLLTDLGYAHDEQTDRVYLWPHAHRHAPPLVLRLIRLTPGEQTVYLLTNVLEPEVLSEEAAAQFFAGRWGEEVFYRSYKQTLQRRSVLSRTPETCLAEVRWTLLGLWLLGLMTVSRLIDAGAPEPWRWSAAQSRDAARRGLRGSRPRRRRWRNLHRDLSQAAPDRYRRVGSKQARNYPRKKREQPPGPPKIKPATAQEIQRAARLPPPPLPLRWTA